MNVQRTQSLYLVHTKRLLKPHLEKTGVHYDHIKQGAFAPSENDNRIMMKSEPAEISFSGSFNPIKKNVEHLIEKNVACSNQIKISANDSLFSLMQSAKTYLKADDSKKSFKNIKSFILKVINAEQSNEPKVSDDISEFLKDSENKENVTDLLKHTRKIITSNSEDKIEESQLHRNVSSTIDEAMSIIHTALNPSKIFKSKALNKFFYMASTNQNVFSALFALGLTCLLRPSTIMALPGQKKNIDDKKYASAHSISSGIIGYVISFIISSPLAKAVTKIGAHPKLFFKERAKYLFEEIGKNKKFSTSKNFTTLQTSVNMGHEIFLAPIRAIITVALIPPILKYVFGMDKNQGEKAPVAVKVPECSQYKTPLQKSFACFMGGNK